MPWGRLSHPDLVLGGEGGGGVVWRVAALRMEETWGFFPFARRVVDIVKFCFRTGGGHYLLHAVAHRNAPMWGRRGFRPALSIPIHPPTHSPTDHPPRTLPPITTHPSPPPPTTHTHLYRQAAPTQSEKLPMRRRASMTVYPSFCPGPGRVRPLLWWEQIKQHLLRNVRQVPQM